MHTPTGSLLRTARRTLVAGAFAFLWLAPQLALAQDAPPPADVKTWHSRMTVEGRKPCDGQVDLFRAPDAKDSGCWVLSRRKGRCAWDDWLYDDSGGPLQVTLCEKGGAWALAASPPGASSCGVTATLSEAGEPIALSVNCSFMSQDRRDFGEPRFEFQPGRFPPPGAKPKLAKALWSGTSVGVPLTWEPGGIFATKPGGSRQRLVENGPVEKCLTPRLKVLSVVGPILSVQRDSVRTCARETSSSVLALDIRSSQPVKLDAVFPKETLLRALLMDAVVQRELAGAPPPQDLEKVLERLRRSWEVDLSGFAFHHLEDDTVAVRLFLTKKNRKGPLTQLGLALPVPPSLRESLPLAARKQEGFFMQDADATTGVKAPVSP